MEPAEENFLKELRIYNQKFSMNKDEFFTKLIHNELGTSPLFLNKVDLGVREHFPDEIA